MKHFREFVFRNWPAKIISILISMLIWIYVGSGQAQIGSFPGKISIEIKNTPAALMAVTDIDSVSIKIIAASNIWKKLGPDSFKATIDLSSYKEGTYELPVEVVTNVEGVQIVEVNPSKIIVRLEKVAEKEIPVILQVEGKPAEGYVVGDWKINPARVKVSGATSVITKILEATTRIYLSGEKDTIQRIVGVVVLDASGKEISNLEFTPAEVEVEVPLVAASSAKTVGVKVNTTGQPAEGFWVSKIETQPSAITITASPLAIGQINFVETKEIDINGLAKTKEFTTTFKPNAGITILDDIEKIIVRINVSRLTSTRQFQVGFSWENLRPHLQVVSSEPSVVTLVLAGSTYDLSNVSLKDIAINIDLSSFDYPGTYTVDILRSNITLPAGISFSSIVPSAISVRLDVL